MKLDYFCRYSFTTIPLTDWLYIVLFSDEIEKLTDLVECSEEMLELKSLEVQSLEKQITLMRDVSNPSQSKDAFRSTEATIKSLQDQISKLQTQLAVSGVALSF